jgi:hypothetical protein
MTSKWIEEIEDMYVDGDDWERILSVLDRIDGLLFQAMLSTENQNLSDQISEEINNGED